MLTRKQTDFMHLIRPSHFFQIVGIVLLMSNLSCQKDDLGPGFDLLFRRDFEIQAGLGVFVVHHFYLNNISSTYQATLQAQGLTDADVKNISNSSGELIATFGDGRLDFISRISVRVFPEGEPDKYVEVAYRDPAPLNNGTLIGLVPSLANVKHIIRENRFGIDVAIETRNITTESIPVTLNLKFRAGT